MAGVVIIRVRLGDSVLEARTKKFWLGNAEGISAAQLLAPAGCFKFPRQANPLSLLHVCAVKIRSSGSM